jgi:hypothetical protein
VLFSGSCRPISAATFCGEGEALLPDGSCRGLCGEGEALLEDGSCARVCGRRLSDCVGVGTDCDDEMLFTGEGAGATRAAGKTAVAVAASLALWLAT